MIDLALPVFDPADEKWPQIVYLLGVLILVGGGIFAYRGRLGDALKHALLWVGAALVLVTLYAYRAPLSQFAAPVLDALAPGRMTVSLGEGGREVLTIAPGPSGHFNLTAEVEGVPVDFVVDTGASSLVLTYEDAERVGIDVGALTFNRMVETANGMTLQARAEIGELKIGSMTLRNVPAGIAQEGQLFTNLLGMNVLSRFAAWRVESGRLIIEPEI
ncbi:retropepsin-like aspartic protease family protein [Afifella pfennigii]|uniref:retropepsin-like aspartic protease family protein n=1 Tax=Afifella pfennigii TaxID=209897 RepID=UPI00068F5F5E|nr:TIGR02281 family clan AA aspartic protease [Afifella pfennigii]